ncbi:MAG: hypothetical protein CL878_11525 [Dehalococcoidia bacterium]|nr:hypothetical protein [Dehalococcoidia bacterium]
MPTPAEDAKVYVTGEVARPGVYEITLGERVIDAVTRAGGMTTEADTLQVNLAVRLRDEMHVHIPTRPGTDDGQQAQTRALPMISEPRSPAYEVGPPTTETTEALRRMNINTATIADLEDLPGLGAISARKIVEYRTLHGPYQTLDDVRQAGVSAALLRRAAAYLVFN